MLKGNDLIIKLNGVAIAAARSCSLDVRTQAIPVSSPQDGNWQHYKGGKSSWVVRVNCLVMSISCGTMMMPFGFDSRHCV